MSNLNQSILENLQLALPPTEEQEKIVRVLSDVTARIDAEIEHRSQLTGIKNGLIQDLLSGTVLTHEADIDIPEAVLAHG